MSSFSEGPESPDEMESGANDAAPVPVRGVQVARKSLSEQVAYFHGVARQKGWWPGLDNPPVVPFQNGWPCDVEEKLALIAGELVGEALDDYRAGRPLAEVRLTDGGKPEGFLTETADAHVRIMDLVGGMGIVAAFERAAMKPAPDNIPANVASALLWMSAPLFVEYQYLGRPDADFYATALAGCLNRIAAAMRSLGLSEDFLNVIDQKATYNETRSFRHGNKVC